jgi:hypothetical protein
MAPAAAPAPTMPMKKGGKVKKMARGGGIEIRGKTKGTMVKMNMGGMAMKKMKNGGRAC